MKKRVPKARQKGPDLTEIYATIASTVETYGPEIVLDALVSAIHYSDRPFLKKDLWTESLIDIMENI